MPRKGWSLAFLRSESAHRSAFRRKTHTRAFRTFFLLRLMTSKEKPPDSVGWADAGSTTTSMSIMIMPLKLTVLLPRCTTIARNEVRAKRRITGEDVCVCVCVRACV